MSRYSSEIVAVGILLAVASALHVLLKNNLISFVPLPLLVSLVVPWVLSSPGYVVIVLIIAGELLSFLPPGLMTAVILTPVALRRVFRGVEVDISFTFAALLIATVILQILLVSLPAIYTGLRTSPTALAGLVALPWQPMVITTVCTTLAAWLLCLGLHAMIPHERRATITFDRELRRRQY